MMPFVFCSESICDVDKSYYLPFVNSVQWHCTISMKTTRLNEGLGRAVREICDFRTNCNKLQFELEFLL